MSATDELRRLLDERDVKYQKLNEHVTWVFFEYRAITFFSDELGVSAEVSYPKPVLNGTKFLTPEQAIAATLGSDDKLLDLAHQAWSIAICAMQNMPIPAEWGNAVESGLREYGIDVDSLPFVTLGSDAKPCYATDYTHARCKYNVNRGWTEDTKFYIPTATLGDGKLTAEQVRDAIRKHAHDDSCYIFEVYGEECDAIADELNATLGESKRAVCSECGTLLSDYILCTPCAEKLAVKR